jgi:glutamyl-Q tRNA(Asp) synthetase
MTDYARTLERLGEHELVYPCFCTRKEIRAEINNAAHAPQGPDDYLYPGICRGLGKTERDARIAKGTPYALRLDVARAIEQAEKINNGPLSWIDRQAGPQTCDPRALGDVVLARKDTPTSYHLSVTLDDHAQGVTLVTRGDDLFSATHTHRLLQSVLALNTPDYHHHRLLVDAAGRRFAKREKAKAIRTLREQGSSADEVRAMAGFGG